MDDDLRIDGEFFSKYLQHDKEVSIEPGPYVAPIYAAQSDLKASEAARLMNVHVHTLKRMLKAGLLVGAYRIGTRGDWRIPMQTIENFKNHGGTWL